MRNIASNTKPEKEAYTWAVGRVKWFDMRKGYGFVTKADKTDVFVHATTCRRSGVVSMLPGDIVRVRVETTAGLQRAAEIKMIAPC